MRTIEVAADVVAAGSALAGLILVYLGSVSASFASFDAAARRSVLPTHQRRVWFSFVGIVFCLWSVGLAIFGKWLDIPCMIVAAIVLLSAGLVWVLAVALLAVLEIK